MNKLILPYIAFVLLSELSLLSSDSSCDQELRTIEENNASTEEQLELHDRLRLTWKKVFNYLHSDLYEGTQELSDGTIMKFIATSIEERNIGGRIVSIVRKKNQHETSCFKAFPLTIPQCIEQASKIQEQSLIIPQRKIDEGDDSLNDSDSVWL